MSKAIHQDFSSSLVTYTQLYIHKSSPLLSEQTWASAAILSLRVFIWDLIQLLPRLPVITDVLACFYTASFCVFSNSKCLHSALFSLSRKPSTVPGPTVDQQIACLILDAAEPWKWWWPSLWQEQICQSLGSFWRTQRLGCGGMWAPADDC